MAGKKLDLLLEDIEVDPLGVNPFVVVGIPALNEEKTIGRLVLAAQDYADAVIVCDDGSTDMTRRIAEGLGAIVVCHEQNSGYGAAVQSLFRRARELHADVLVTIDGDGQHDPREIPSLLQPVVDGVSDVVVGSRFLDKNGTTEMGRYRQLGVKAITKLVNGSAKNGVSDAQSGFRAYGKRALERLVLSEMGMSASLELLVNLKECGLTVCEVPISCKYAKGVGVKTSTKNPVSQGLGLLMSIVKFVVEDRPLMVLGAPGVGFLIAGAFFGVWLLNIYASNHIIITNIALATIGFFFLGFFLITTSMTLYGLTRLSKRLNAK